MSVVATAERRSVRGNPWVPVLFTLAMTAVSTGLFVAAVIGINHYGSVTPPSGTDKFLTAILVAAAIILGTTVAFSVMLFGMAVRQVVAGRRRRGSAQP